MEIKRNDPNHILFTTDDLLAPNSIKDRNGDVALGLCKVCGKGEVELESPCDPVAALLAVKDAELEQAKKEVNRLKAEVAVLKQKLRMVVSHATMGSTDGEGVHINDISVKITASRNTLFNKIKDSTLESKVPAFYCRPSDCRETNADIFQLQVAYEQDGAHTMPLYRDAQGPGLIIENERFKDALVKIASAKSYSSAYLKRLAKDGLGDEI